MGIQRARSLFRLGPAGGFDLVQRHACLFPQLCAFAPLTKGQANDGHVDALGLMQGDGPAASPDKVGSVGRDDEGSFLTHGFSL